MTDMPSHAHPDGSTHLGLWCGDCPGEHRAFLAAQHDAEHPPEGAIEDVAERLHDVWPHLFCDGFEVEVAREALEAADAWLAGDEPAGDQVARYIAHHGIPTIVRPGASGGQAEATARAQEFIRWVAQNSIVADDFPKGNEAFNEVVRAARALAAELGITYQPRPEQADEDISAEEYEVWPGNQPGGTATGGSG